MRVPRPSTLLVLALLTPAPWAQADWRRARLDETLDPVTTAAAAPTAMPTSLQLVPVQGEDLAAIVAVEPAPVSRELLEGGAESLHRYQALPGGIVLGLTARVPAELSGARITRENGRFCLTTGERFLALPPIDEAALRGLVAFVDARGDALVDLLPASRTPTRVAAALTGSGLEDRLIRMDGVPHARLEWTQGWKTLIVDREPQVLVHGDELRLAADLETRTYADTPNGSIQRVATVEALAVTTCGPRVAADLGTELAPLAEIAGWLGLLRWIREHDPEGWVSVLGGTR